MISEERRKMIENARTFKDKKRVLAKLLLEDLKNLSLKDSLTREETIESLTIMIRLGLIESAEIKGSSLRYVHRLPEYAIKFAYFGEPKTVETKRDRFLRRRHEALASVKYFCPVCKTGPILNVHCWIILPRVKRGKPPVCKKCWMNRRKKKKAVKRARLDIPADGYCPTCGKPKASRHEWRQSSAGFVYCRACHHKVVTGKVTIDASTFTLVTKDTPDDDVEFHC